MVRIYLTESVHMLSTTVIFCSVPTIDCIAHEPELGNSAVVLHIVTNSAAFIGASWCAWCFASFRGCCGQHTAGTGKTPLRVPYWGRDADSPVHPERRTLCQRQGLWCSGGRHGRPARPLGGIIHCVWWKAKLCALQKYRDTHVLPHLEDRQDGGHEDDCQTVGSYERSWVGGWGGGGDEQSPGDGMSDTRWDHWWWDHWPAGEEGWRQ